MKLFLEVVLAHGGRPRIDENLAHVAQDGAKLEPRWRQDGPSWCLDGHLETIWGSFLSIFHGLGSDF